MKRQAKRYEKKDKAIYNAKWNPDRDRREDYKNLKKVPKVYALDMNTDEFLEKLLESQELSDLFDRQQVLGTKATFVIEMEIDEFTTVACEFKYFNNLNRYGGQKYQVINGKVDVFSGNIRLLSDEPTRTYLIYHGTMFELMFHIKINVLRFNTSHVIVFNSVLSTVEFTGDAFKIQHEIGGFYMENSTTQTIGILSVHNTEPVFVGKEVHVFHEIAMLGEDACLFKDCLLHMNIQIDDTYFRILRRNGNKFVKLTGEI